MGKITWYMKKIYSKLPVIIFDIFAIPTAWYASYWLRYNMQPIPKNLVTPQSLIALLILIIVQTVCYYRFKVYRGIWRFSSLNDVAKILRAVFFAVTIATTLFYLTSILSYIPRSVLPLYSIILTTLLCGARLGFRFYSDKANTNHEKTGLKKVIIIGAGRAGEGLIRDLKRFSTYYISGLVDDNTSKKGLEIHGVRVLGTIANLRDLVKTHGVDLVFIAIPSAGSATMRKIVNHCENCQVPFRTLPSISALATGRVKVDALREVKIEDLLGRDQVNLEWDKINAAITGKKILVTGGGGSIGSELCRQILSLSPKELLLLDHSEYNLYQAEIELKSLFPNITIKIALNSVTDKVAVRGVFSSFKPDIIFHAAAYKHVPLLEEQVRVAVYNNIIGTKIVAEASIETKASKFILISTDKAVNPTNIMGTTKRVAEIYCQNLSERAETQFITVRFGNVLGSIGSVVPLFQKQLSHGGPLTVTHPDIERYFMTIPEACQLILQAMVNGVGGEIFVLNMGEPIKIKYLAEQMIRLSGKEPGKDIAIQYTGLRRGEKLFEELFHDSESLSKTEHEKLFKANYRKINWKELTKMMDMLDAAAKKLQHEELIVLLKSIVPEFTSDQFLNISSTYRSEILKLVKKTEYSNFQIMLS